MRVLFHFLFSLAVEFPFIAWIFTSITSNNIEEARQTFFKCFKFLDPANGNSQSIALIMLFLLLLNSVLGFMYINKRVTQNKLGLILGFLLLNFLGIVVLLLGLN